MTVNVGTLDRIARLIAGAALLAFALGYLAPGTGWNWIGWVGVVPIPSLQPFWLVDAVRSSVAAGQPTAAHVNIL